jgi:hypothetical protein
MEWKGILVKIEWKGINTISLRSSGKEWTGTEWSGLDGIGTERLTRSR